MVTNEEQDSFFLLKISLQILPIGEQKKVSHTQATKQRDKPIQLLHFNFCVFE
jgi:hypothetical protein